MRTKIAKIIAFLAMNTNESLKLARFFSILTTLALRLRSFFDFVGEK